jgi:hypothetical protein
VANFRRIRILVGCKAESHLQYIIRKERKKNTNVGCSDENLSPLALSCSKVSLVRDRFIAYLVVGRALL